jgi:hypothetical protein
VVTSNCRDQVSLILAWPNQKRLGKQIVWIVDLVVDTTPTRSQRREIMSRLHQLDGLSILARYTSVAAIAIASSASPLRSAANEQVRDDRVNTEASEDGQTAAGPNSSSVLGYSKA